MSFCTITNAEVFAFTRERRAIEAEMRRQRFLAIYGPTIYLRPAPPMMTRPAAPAPPERSAFKNEVAAMRARRRDRLIWAQHGRCYLCEGLFDERRLPTEDHVRPRARGGGNARNILMACPPCNQEKADRKPTARELAVLAHVNAILDGDEIGLGDTFRLAA